ncbi:probable LRR receptor-like serine/threonine-protein kinase At1g56140 isoform X2 [Zingiber officinale]|uniref:probable LRR receptor-like serine/threonine-protein kinase At1g56140 isoform X2 n=1 Tax=Zingiber officinale TaxID=94328 RepID=UPI001C4CA7B3|nr:probable LRR receptor-like serine/threonine-protein kinase At1g56140 isoform X2 [Zingiber officinale]
MVVCESHDSLPRVQLLFFFILPLLLLQGRVAAQVNATTDPNEVLALNTILERLGLSTSSQWNFNDNPCTGVAIDQTPINNLNPGIKCDCTYNNNNTCHITHLKVYALNVYGLVPEELQNLPYLFDLNLAQNYLTGSLPAVLGNLTNLQYLSLGINALSGPIPPQLGNLRRLVSLSISNNYFNGSVPPEFGNLRNLEQWYMDSSGLSGELPQNLSNLRNLHTVWASDNNFIGRIPDYIGTWTNLTILRFQGNSFQGPIPPSFANLIQMIDLRIGDILNGSSSLDFISNMTSLSTLVLRNNKISDTIPLNFQPYNGLTFLDLSFNNITGQVPQSLFNLRSLAFLFLGNNSLTGSLPRQKSTALMNIDLSYNQLSGSYPSWVSQGNLQLNLVANNFVIDDSNNSNLPSGLNCLQRSIPCHRGSPIYSSFAIECGGSRVIRSSDNTVYEIDNANLTTASYYVTDSTRWAVSSVGHFMDAAAPSYVRASQSEFLGTRDTELFLTARLSPSSLRYYGLGLENGNYTIKLQFAEIAYPDVFPDFPDLATWQSLGTRLFNIYIQDDLKERDFDIRKQAGGRSIVAVSKEYTVLVTDNFLEIHFFWSGKGTCCLPTQGSYGPLISSISVSPAFTPTVSNRLPSSKKNRAGLIAGISVGVLVLGLLALCGVIFIRQRKRILNEEAVLTGLDVKPFVFSYAELRAATEDFSSSNILGEGGFGLVFKGILSNGRKVAVKKLSTTSHQGKGQFLTEIATISAVQHRNLVKLHGCCVDEENQILVYEYLENRSLDQIIFGKRDLHLDWPNRFNILLGVAKGLAYLHEESIVRIVHRDVKASNILLDVDLNPKISDFGLAKLYDDKISHISTKVAGTFGYLAPEYALRGHLTEKADVFAFGVLALEVVSGRPNSDRLDHETVYLLEWAWNLLEDNRKLEAVDRSLASFDEEEINRVIGVALLCTQASPAHRPPMSRVVAMLVGDQEIMDVTERPSYLLLWQCAENSDASYRRHVTERPSFPLWSTDSVKTRILSVQSTGDCSIDEGR